jgi:hypothetical protein
MHAAVEAADRVVALWSSAYFEDGRYTEQEWSAALVTDDRGGHRLVPVQVERCTLPRLLRPLVRVELFGVGEAEAARRLLEAVRGPRRPDGVPVFPGRGAAGVSSGGGAGPRPPGVLPPVWNAGPRNRDFVGREAALASVHERLRSGGAAVVQALHGLGGVGKTQLALEYAYRHADAYDLVWWINADQAGLVGEQYAALAAELGLVAPCADAASAVGALRAHLRGCGRWLLVFDDAESPAELRDWLPAGPGHVMITSRDPGWEELAARVEVDVLTRRESTTLIQARLLAVEPAAAARLAEALDDLPLALAQAAGFLAETGMPVGCYLYLLDTDAGGLLDEHPPQAHPHSLAATVTMSADRLAHVDPAALGFLRVGAFVAPDPIPVDLLTRRVRPADPGWPAELAAVAAAGSAPVAAHRSLGQIGRFGLARIDDRGMQLHRLTQAILRQTLPAGQAAAHRDYAQALLVAADPGDYRDLATWSGWTRVLPHLLAADPAASPSPGFRDLACRAAWYLWYRGESRLARKLVVRLRGRWRDSLGPDDRHTLQISGLFVRILTNVGAGSHAREIGADTVARARRALGDDRSGNPVRSAPPRRLPARTGRVRAGPQAQRRHPGPQAEGVGRRPRRRPAQRLPPRPRPPRARRRGGGPTPSRGGLRPLAACVRRRTSPHVQRRQRARGLSPRGGRRRGRARHARGDARGRPTCVRRRPPLDSDLRDGARPRPARPRRTRRGPAARAGHVRPGAAPARGLPSHR